MVYEWKPGHGKSMVDPDLAGKEIERLAVQYGGAVSSARIVDAARPNRSPLHNAFTWQDELAAEQWRRQEARQLTTSLVVVQADADGNEVREPAFFHVNYVPPDGSDKVEGYQSISMVVEEPRARASAEELLLAQLEGLRERYGALAEFAPVWKAIEKARKRLEKKKAA